MNVALRKISRNRLQKSCLRITATIFSVHPQFFGFWNSSLFIGQKFYPEDEDYANFKGGFDNYKKYVSNTFDYSSIIPSSIKIAKSLCKTTKNCNFELRIQLRSATYQQKIPGTAIRSDVINFGAYFLINQILQKINLAHRWSCCTRF